MSRKVLLRLEPEDYELLQKTAKATGQSMSDLLRNGLRMACGGSAPAGTTREAVMQAFKLMTGVGERLADGWRLVPPDEPAEADSAPPAGVDLCFGV